MNLGQWFAIGLVCTVPVGLFIEWFIARFVIGPWRMHWAYIRKWEPWNLAQWERDHPEPTTQRWRWRP